MTRPINDVGLTLIKSFESFSAVPYQDEGGVWTNGYGNTHGVTESTPAVTEPQAAETLRANLEEFGQYVLDEITVDLSDNQYSALVSLCENCGTAPLVGSLGQLLNQGNYDEAADHFLLWNKERINGELVESDGLLRRRQAERALFLTTAA